MLLDLREIITIPGGKVSFDFIPDISEATGGSVVSIKETARAEGSIVNSAGVLMFSAIVDATCVCVCARCLKEFEYPVHKRITAILTEEGAGENPDGYFLQGDKIDAEEIIVTEIVLDMDDRVLCRDDCAALCQSCGQDLNGGSCMCEKEIDSRLAVLGQLLE